MASENDNKNSKNQSSEKGQKKRQKSMRFRVFKILSVVAVLIFIFIVTAPAIISTNAVSGIIKSVAADKLDATIEMINFSVGWRKGVTIDGLSYADKNGVIVDAQQVFVKFKWLPLFGGDIDITESYIENAKITLLTSDESEMADKSVAIAAAFTPSKNFAAAQINEGFRIAKFNYIRQVILDLKNVDLSLELVEDSGEHSSFLISKIDGKIRINPPGRTSGIDLAAQTAEDAPLTLYALASRPEMFFDKTEFDSTIKFEARKFDTRKLTPFLKSAENEFAVNGLIDIKLDAEIRKGLVEKFLLLAGSDQIDFITEKVGNAIAVKDFNSTVRLTTDENFADIREITVNSNWFNFDIKGQVPLNKEGLAKMFEPDSEITVDGKFSAKLVKALEQFPNLFGSSNVEVTSGDINGRVSTTKLDAGKAFYGTLSISNFSATAEDKKLRLAEPILVRAEIASRPQGIFIDPIEVTSAFMNITCSGLSDDIKIQGYFPLAKMQQELGDFIDFKDYKYNGEVFFDGEILPKKSIFNGVLSARDLVITSEENKRITEPHADITFGLKYDEIEKRIWATSMFLKSTLLGNAELLQGYANLREEEPDKVVAMFKTYGSMPNIMDVLDIYRAKPEDLDVSGSYSSTARIIFRDDLIRINSEDTGVSEFLIRSGNNVYQTKALKLAVDADLMPNVGDYNLKNFELSNDWINLNLSRGNFKFTDERNRIEADFILAYDLEKMNEIEQFLPQDMFIAGARKITGNISTDYDPSDSTELLENLNAKFGFGFDEIKYAGLNFGQADFIGSVENGKFNIPQVDIPLNGGSLNFGASADLADEQIVLAIDDNIELIKDVSINDALAYSLLRYVNPIFAGSLDTSGVLNVVSRKFSLPLSGNITDGIDADAQVSLSGLNLKAAGLLQQILELTGASDLSQAKLSIEPSNIKIQNGKVFNESMDVLINDKVVNFKGDISFNGAIGMDITLPYSFNIGKSKQSNIVLPIDGDIISPRIDTRKILSQNQVLDKIIDENVDEQTGEMIKKGIQSLQDLFNKPKKE